MESLKKRRSFFHGRDETKKVMISRIENFWKNLDSRKKILWVKERNLQPNIKNQANRETSLCPHSHQISSFVTTCIVIHVVQSFSRVSCDEWLQIHQTCEKWSKESKRHYKPPPLKALSLFYMEIEGYNANYCNRFCTILTLNLQDFYNFCFRMIYSIPTPGNLQLLSESSLSLLQQDGITLQDLSPARGRVVKIWVQIARKCVLRFLFTLKKTCW